MNKLLLFSSFVLISFNSSANVALPDPVSSMHFFPFWNGSAYGITYNHYSGYDNPTTYPNLLPIPYTPGEEIVYTKSSSELNDHASAAGVIKYDVPSIYLSAGTPGIGFVRVDGWLTYHFQLNSDENRFYDVVVKAYGETKSNATILDDGLFDYRLYGEINISGLYTASFCGGDSNARGYEICSNIFGENIGTHNTFGEKVISLQSNQIYRVDMYASIYMQTANGSASGYVYVDPMFSLLDPTIQNVSFQFSNGIQNLAAPIPEPETIGMLMAGLGLIGFIQRRRVLS